MTHITHLSISAQEKEFYQNHPDLANYKQKFIELDNFTDEALSESQETEILTVFVHTQITPEIISKLPNLKLICARSTGYDNIHIPSAKNAGITVCNVPYYGDNTVAEQAFAHILALTKKLPQILDRTKKLNFEYHDLLGQDLENKTLGVIGTGHIGLNTIRIAKGFGMRVLAFDVKPNPEAEAKLGFEYTNQETLYRQADILSLHAPHLPATHHMVNLETIKKLKKGVVLINVSRGQLVQNQALLYGLENGILAGAGLDVIDHEDNYKDDLVKQIITKPNVTYTPHCAYYTQEALQRIWQATVENIINFENQEVQNLVC